MLSYTYAFCRRCRELVEKAASGSCVSANHSFDLMGPCRQTLCAVGSDAETSARVAFSTLFPDECYGIQSHDSGQGYL